LKAIIHIGAEKTGTTSIQEFLARNRSKLISHGILYPSCFGSPNQVNLTAYCLADTKDGKIDDIRRALGLVDIVKINDFRTHLRGAIQQEILAHQDIATILMSNEHLQSRLITLDEVQRLKYFVSLLADEIKIILYIRRQDRVAVSYFSTKLKAGLQDHDNVFPREMLQDQLPIYYDYNAVLQLYEEVFGIENIIVRVFEPGRLVDQDLIADFSAQCGLGSDWGLMKAPRRNGSLSEAGIQFFRRFNEVVPRFIDDRPNPFRDTIIRDVMKRFHGAGPKVSRLEAEIFYKHFEESNQEIVTRYFPEIHGDLFESDFDDYQESISEAPSTEDFIDLAIHLWCERTIRVNELKLENALLKFLVAVKSGESDSFSSLPDLALGAHVTPPTLFRYMGALLYSDEPARLIEAVAQVTDSEVRGRQVFIASLGLAYLRAGKLESFNDHIQKYIAPKKYWNSLSTMRDADLASCPRSEWIEFLKNGDAMQRETYAKCLAWIES
jgi:hypothetical protein